MTKRDVNEMRDYISKLSRGEELDQEEVRFIRSFIDESDAMLEFIEAIRKRSNMLVLSCDSKY
jgi:dsDNA-specific endonuclease/ATPase MutS2